MVANGESIAFLVRQGGTGHPAAMGGCPWQGSQEAAAARLAPSLATCAKAVSRPDDSGIPMYPSQYPQPRTSLRAGAHADPYHVRPRETLADGDCLSAWRRGTLRAASTV